MEQNPSKIGRNMDSYTSFAKVYDTFMDNVPYTEWAEYIANQLEKYDIPKTALNLADSEAGETCVKLSEKNAALDEALLEEKGSVLDLGCGTGTLTSLLYQKGYSMMGVDNSEEMLEIAQEKKKMLQDVRSEISDLAVEIASKVVEREISPRDYDGFVDEFIRNVGENN